MAPPDRPRAFRKLVGLLRSGGLLALTLRHGPDDGRGGHPVKRLTAERLDVDHCLPWSVWPCGDFWNLLPADWRVDQQSKRDRLPSSDALWTAHDAIAAWWQAAYLRPGDAVLPSRFAAEARASLPGFDVSSACHPDDVQAATALQRMRLRQDQGVPE